MSYKFSKFKSGFTMIEVVVVMAIAVSLTSLTVALRSDSGAARDVDSAAQQLAAQLRVLQNDALNGKEIAGENICRFKFDSSALTSYTISYYNCAAVPALISTMSAVKVKNVNLSSADIIFQSPRGETGNVYTIEITSNKDAAFKKFTSINSIGAVEVMNDPTAVQALACNYTYTEGPCISGNKTLTNPVGTPAGCIGTPETSRACVSPVCTYWNYTPWSPALCPVGSVQTRLIASSSPSGCAGGSPAALSRSCVYTAPGLCSGYGPDECDASLNNCVQGPCIAFCNDGIKNGNETNVDCGGPTCGACTCTSFTYSPFTPTDCPPTGIRSRALLTSSPSGCVGGTPGPLGQFCTYLGNCSEYPACTASDNSGNCSEYAACSAFCGDGIKNGLESGVDCGGLCGACTCTSFTYSPFAPTVCPVEGRRTRSILTSSPSGCVGGTPAAILESCTYVPPATCSGYLGCDSSGNNCVCSGYCNDGIFNGEEVAKDCGGSFCSACATCSSFVYSAWGTCQANNIQTRTVISSTPSGCAGGTPVTSQSCTYVPPTCSSWTYSAWGTCQANSTQTRTITSSAPTGCAGGLPATLTQSCTYVPPATCSGYSGCDSSGNNCVCSGYCNDGIFNGEEVAKDCGGSFCSACATCSSFVYSAWGTCQANNIQTRTVISSTPSGCVGGTPILTGACAYVPTCHAWDSSGNCTSFY